MTVIVLARGAPVSCVVAAAGLGWLGVVDWATHRLPTAKVRLLGVVVAAALVTTAMGASDPALVVRAGVAWLGLLVAVGAVWWWLPSSIGFGDVKLIALAGASAAAVSWPTLARAMFATTLASACLAGGLALSYRARGVQWTQTVPLAPALCAGLVAGVVL